MQTYKTLEFARTAAKAMPDIHCIVEIEHATEGRCFIAVKAPMKTLEIALRNKPMPDIKRLIAEHSILTAAEASGAREQHLRENTNCERCGARIDGNTAYSQQEWYKGTRVTARYCESCRQLLSGIGAGEQTALQERAAADVPHEAYTKEDF